MFCNAFDLIETARRYSGNLHGSAVNYRSSCLIPGISASMLSYRHSFHAGNHADVLKHTVQSLIIESLKEKEKPFLYLDTHAGAGRYQLSGEHAERTGEYLEGISRIWQQDDLPAEMAAYISVIQHFNRSGQLRYYPGSPLIARQLLREQDSLQLTELHPSDFPLLRSEFRKTRARVEKPMAISS
jgi:23S rRNA (adenine2030-N6)-methyltransferase